MVYSGYLIGFQFIIWISRILKRKVIFRSTLLHGDDPETLLSKNLLMRSLNKFVLNQLNIYFAINPVFADQFRTLLGNKIQIVNLFQGIDSKRFYPSSLQHKNQIRKKIQIPSNELVLLSVGILLKKKGYEKVFPLLTTLDIPFIYVVVGEYLPDQVRNLSNEEMKEMHTLFYQGKDLLGDRIRFTGPVEAIENYFHAADIFLLSSLQEGTPNVLLEALACGLPCITRSLPGISGLLTFHEKNALEFDHIRVLPQLIKDLADHPQKMKNIGMNASETIHENYTFERIADKLFSSLNG
jgi:UDP-glucose:(heptosyl)LPS alpha-1,3-glucosyltransferase